MMNPVEQRILHAIYEEFPTSLKEIERLYKACKSFDVTILTLKKSIKVGVNPLDQYYLDTLTDLKKSEQKGPTTREEAIEQIKRGELQLVKTAPDPYQKSVKEIQPKTLNMPFVTIVLSTSPFCYLSKNSMFASSVADPSMAVIFDVDFLKLPKATIDGLAWFVRNYAENEADCSALLNQAITEHSPTVEALIKTSMEAIFHAKEFTGRESLETFIALATNLLDKGLPPSLAAKEIAKTMYGYAG